MAFRNTGPISLCSPRPPFGGSASTLWARPASHSNRNWFSRNGFSATLRRFSVPGTPRQAQTLPACFFDILTVLNSGPFGLELAPGCFWQSGEVMVTKPVSRLLPGNHGQSSNHRSPLGFHPLRIIAPSPIPTAKFTLIECPITLHSPNVLMSKQNNVQINVPGPLHSTKLYCSFEPLGTIFMMHPFRISVNRKLT